MIMQRAAGHVVAEVEEQKIAADDMNLQRMRERTMSEMTEPVEMPWSWRKDLHTFSSALWIRCESQTRETIIKLF